jgi:peroxiredoxin Q/BCP/two-component system osmolarity sensor histidine kinase EnvZ
MLKAGDEAPDFQSPNADLELMQLADFKDQKNLVLYFYPKDDTPGCTIEALEFSDRLDDFNALETEVLGVSRDNCLSHGEFRDQNGLTIRLLADIDGNICRDYAVWREKKARGERRMGILRSTFVIDKVGIIRHALYDIRPKGHAATILELVRKM